MNLRTAQTILIGVASFASVWGIQYALGAATNYSYPAIHDCMYPQVNQPCRADSRVADYPITNPEPLPTPTNTPVRVPYKGCYDTKYKWKSAIPGGGKCTDPRAPIRVEVKYFTACPTGSTIVACPAGCTIGGGTTGLPSIACTTCCTDGSKVNVTPIIKGDSADVVTLKTSGDPTTGIGMDTVTLDPKQSGDPAYDACRSIYEMGYNWDPTNRVCNIDPARQCSRLGFVWENGRCFNKCDASACTLNMCQGHIYQPGTQTCVCIGSSTTTDSNGSPCVGTPTSTPTTTPTPPCTGYITVMNNEKGQTVNTDYTIDGTSNTLTTGGLQNRTIVYDCNKSISTLVSAFSDSIPPMCVKCGPNAATCGYKKGTNASCSIGVMTDGSTYQIYSYAEGSNPGAAATPTANPTYTPTSAPTVATNDIQVVSVSTTANVNTIRSGITTGTVTVQVKNNSATPASVIIYVSGPPSACVINPDSNSLPVAVTLTANETKSFTSSSCTFYGQPGNYYIKAAAELNGEDSNTNNNSASLQVKIIK